MICQKPIQGVVWYNLLANPAYAHNFSYIEAGVPDRNALIVDGDDDEENDCVQSDMVKILINMAYAPRTVTKEFTFGPDIHVTFKEAMEKDRKELNPNMSSDDQSDDFFKDKG